MRLKTLLGVVGAAAVSMVAFPAHSAPSTCWYARANSTEEADAESCDVTEVKDAEGNFSWDVRRNGGTTVSIILYSDNGKPDGADVTAGGETFGTNWYKDEEGDIAIEIEGDTFFFTPKYSYTGNGERNSESAISGARSALGG